MADRIDPSVLENRVGEVRRALQTLLEAPPDPTLEERVKREFLSRSGALTGLFGMLRNLPPESRAEGGRQVNELKGEVEAALEELANRRDESESAAGGSSVDVTLPGIRRDVAHAHPISQTQEDMLAIFASLGYSYSDYPQVESEFYNFDGLNTPEWHPARDMHDSFYAGPNRVLRTHTSAFQVHAMEHFDGSTLREVTTGRCFRNDPIDASHSPVFHQFDGLAVGEGITFAELKWTLSEMAHRLFGDEAEIRFRPSFFPFTTPSAEVDVVCVLCSGKGCAFCKNTGWVEILGCGMTHPEVLRSGKIDPDRYQGFAFGIGVDRVSTLRWGVPDIRLYFENDLAFLSQF